MRRARHRHWMHYSSETDQIQSSPDHSRSTKATREKRKKPSHVMSDRHHGPTRRKKSSLVSIHFLKPASSNPLLLAGPSKNLERCVRHRCECLALGHSWLQRLKLGGSGANRTGATSKQASKQPFFFFSPHHHILHFASHRIVSHRNEEPFDF